MATDSMADIFDGSSSDDEPFEGFSYQDVDDARLSRDNGLAIESDSDINLSSSESESDSEAEIDDHVANVNVQTVWTENLSRIAFGDFTGPEPGPTFLLDPSAVEVDFFLRFFPVALIDFIRNETNRYADQRISEKADPKWAPVTSQDIRTFLGLRVYMSVLQLPQFDMYWSGDWLFGGLRIPEIITRERFEKISQYLHTANNTDNPRRGEPGHDKLHHVRPLLDQITETCLRSYNPHQQTSVDEAMVAFRGRLGIRQYLPSKPTKYGIKVWMRADPRNGYCNQFQVYTGKVEGRPRQPQVPLSTRVVLDLTVPIQGHNYVVNMDNFFSSPDLFAQLLDRQILARGTLRTNRIGFPHQIINPRVTKQRLKDQGAKIVAQKGPTAVSAWKDKKVVHFLSTADDPSLPDVLVKRRKKDGSQIEVPCPPVVKNYNENMFGVDRADQIRSEYPTFRMCKKWWVYLFFFLVDVCIGNAFIVMSESTNHQIRSKTGRPKARTLLSFRMQLAKQLIGEARGVGRKRKRAVPAPDPVQVPQRPHMPVVLEKRHRCRHCSKNGKRAESNTHCDVCQFALCVKCFKPFHDELK